MKGRRLMNPLRRILFPVDFSPASVAMVPSVIEMAKRFDATVTVLNAFNLVHEYSLAPDFELTGDADPPAILFSPAIQALRDQREKQVEEFARTQFSSVRYSTRIEDGEPALVIDWAVRRENADLVMMPTKGLGRFRRMLLGSVTAKVLHDVSCPVFTSVHVPEPARVSSEGFRSILCALDLNSEAESIFKAAAILAHTYGARICILHLDPSSNEKSEPPTALELTRSFEQVDAVDHAEGSRSLSLCVLGSTISEGIRQMALEEKADLVVVGRGHSQGPISQAWSSLYTIIRESPCPVLSV
jgi:nucleotide-binding universal stress UspA family protein